MRIISAFVNALLRLAYSFTLLCIILAMRLMFSGIHVLMMWL